MNKNDFPVQPASASGYRYVSARGLSSQVLDLERLDVEDAAGDRLGDVDGFLVETASGRPRFVVVDAGGWFRTRRFLLPVEHARFDARRKGLSFDLGRDAIRRFPDIADERIETLQPDELVNYPTDVTRACCPDDEDFRRFEAERRDESPSWWHATRWTTGVPGAPTVSATAPAERDFVVGRSEERWRRSGSEGQRVDPANERAQPGDVIGIETGGERTSIGDTAEDEDRRRERAEEEMRRRRS